MKDRKVYFSNSFSKAVIGRSKRNENALWSIKSIDLMIELSLYLNMIVVMNIISCNDDVKL